MWVLNLFNNRNNLSIQITSMWVLNLLNNRNNVSIQLKFCEYLTRIPEGFCYPGKQHLIRALLSHYSFMFLIFSIISYSISSMQHLLALFLLSSYILYSQQMLFNSQLNSPTARFSSISEAYLSLSGQSLLLLSRKDNSSAAQILDLSLANGTLVVENSYESGLDFSNYWQIYHLEKEIMSFAISIS